jgi:formylglycine-generating enzyme required for sulfatase activity
MKLAPIPAGEFLMGCSAEEFERFNREASGYFHPEKSEMPQHKVKITKPFFMGAYLVTQGQYEKVIGSNPSSRPKEGPDLPVDTVNWFNGMEFCKKLSALAEEKRAGRVYRLPTEAEWEYAARAGTTTATYFGNTMSAKQANFDGSKPLGNAEKVAPIGHTVKVGAYPPNRFGLYDMHGNLWQWCLDGPRTYTNAEVEDPRGPEDAKDRVLRGGSWRDGAVRAAFRKPRPPEQNYQQSPITGFRVMMIETAGN